MLASFLTFELIEKAKSRTLLASMCSSVKRWFFPIDATRPNCKLLHKAHYIVIIPSALFLMLTTVSCAHPRGILSPHCWCCLSIFCSWIYFYKYIFFPFAFSVACTKAKTNPCKMLFSVRFFAWFSWQLIIVRFCWALSYRMYLFEGDQIQTAYSIHMTCTVCDTPSFSNFYSNRHLPCDFFSFGFAFCLFRKIRTNSDFASTINLDLFLYIYEIWIMKKISFQWFYENVYEVLGNFCAIVQFMGSLPLMALSCWDREKVNGSNVIPFFQTMNIILLQPQSYCILYEWNPKYIPYFQRWIDI